MASAPLHLRFDPASHPDPDARVAGWRDAMSLSVDVEMTPEQARDFSGRISFHPFGAALLVEARCTAHTMVRSGRTIARSGDTHVLVDVFTEGGFRGVLGGRPLSVEAGDCVLIDLRRTLRVCLADSRFIGFVVPRVQFEAQAPGLRPVHGLRLAGGSPEAQLIGPVLTSLAAQAPALSLPRRNALGHGLVGLIAACIGDRVMRATEWGHAFPEVRPQAAQVHRYIARHASDPDLDPARVCAAFDLSRAALYRMFEPEGGVAQAIRRRRAGIAHHLLGEAGARYRSIEAVALASGFSNARALVRALQHYHGMTPSRVRGDGRRSPSEAGTYSVHIGKMFDPEGL